MKKTKDMSDAFIVLFIMVVSLITYWWTVSLPITCDGLMHLNDTTDLSSVENLVKIFYTFEDVGKPEYSSTLGFHRPVFNEIIVTLIKIVTNYDVRKIRIIIVFAFSLVIICSYMLGKELFQSRLKAIILALLMNFSIIYYSGIYEFGLSFSIWLTLFVIDAFYFTIKYVRYNNKIELVFSFIFTFLAMYTKESAMCLGIALSWYVFINEISKNRKITFRLWLYGIIQLIILFIYLCTRYLKLGSLFTAIAVDAEKISFIETIRKIYGYYLLSYNISNPVIPDYMCVRLPDKYIGIPLILFIFSIYIFIQGIYMMYKNKQYRCDITAYLGMYIFLLVPVFKVNRNAPYYGDICVVCIFAIVLTLINFKNRISSYVYFLILVLFISAGISNMYISTQEGRHYLSVQANEAKDLKEQLQNIKNEINKDEVILTTNWAKSSDSLFIYHHNGYGAFYKYNIEPFKKVDLVSKTNIYDDALFIDYYRNTDTNRAEVFAYPQENTKFIQVAYGSENKNIEIGFIYNNNYYYSNIDIETKKQWSDDNCIYCIVPKECTLDVVGSDCSISYPRGE